MKQLVQSVRDGELRVVEVPRPAVDPTQVLVATSRSLVSAGTERAVRELGQASLLAKARARPDLVRQVLAKARAEGIGTTRRAVERRLDQEMPLGYSGVGVAVEVGEAVPVVRPGQRVATGGAPHGDLQVVQGLLAVPVPDEVADEEAAFATVAAIALHGLRLAEVGPGSRVAVIGLGLVGQLAVRLAQAAGCLVAAIDLRPFATERAAATGALALQEEGDATTEAVMGWTGGDGVDAVLVTAATKSSEPVRRATALARDRAQIVVVGDVGLELDRRPLYDKELSLRVARSYGPGRYEPAYEDLAVDYPPGQVPFTEGRNLRTVLELLAAGRLSVADLITHTFAFDDALDAYELLAGDEPYLGVELVYGEPPTHDEVVQLAPRRSGGEGLGVIGAGGFAAGTLVPGLRAAGFERLVSVASASGRTARALADAQGAEQVVSTADQVIDDPDVDVVVVATPHGSHAELVTRALEAGKHVFCEKPLALSADELAGVEAAWREHQGQLMVGFNRRWSPAAGAARDVLGRTGGPLVMTYRVSAGPVSPGHWYGDRRHGGRLLGEVCHMVDLCCSLADSPVEWVHAMGSGADEVLLAPDVVVTVRFADGSLATIAYGADGHPSTPKERLEVMGRGHTVVIDDFRATSVDGRATKGTQDKGHARQLARFRRMVVGAEDGTAVTESALASSWAVLAAGRSLVTGQAVRPDALRAQPDGEA